MTGLTARAQVEWKDRYVTLASGDQKNPSIAQPPGASYTVIVWEDYRSGESDIYAQKIENVNGIATWFPIDGVPVCTATGEQRNPKAAFDGDGNVIICWEDYRNDPSMTIAEIWATKILITDGTEDVNWSGGTSVSGTSVFHAYRPRIVGTIDGAFITWTDTRNSQVVPPVVDCDIYAQYLLSSSPTPTVWTANGICVNATTGNDQRNSEIVLDYLPQPSTGRYGVVIAYESNFKGYSKIMMDRIDPSGSRVWGDLPVAPYDGDQFNVKIDHAGLQSTSTGSAMMVVATWEDWRNYGVTSVDVYAQMVRVDNGVSQWPNTSSPTGLEIAGASNRQLKPDIIAQGADAVAVIAWEDRRNAGNDIDVYANRVDLGTQSLAAVNGVAVSSTIEREQSICMTKYTGAQNVWIGWERSGDIYYQKYDWSSFTEQLPANGWPVTIAKGDQTAPVLGAGVFVYEDGRRQSITDDDQNDLNIYAQIPGDECDLPTYMHWKDVLANWTPNSVISDKRFAVDDEGNTYVTWFEMRVTDQSGDGVPGIYAQKLDKDGVPRWSNDGILLSMAPDCGKPAVAAYSNNSSAVFAWRENDSILVARVDADGTIAWRSCCLNTPNGGDLPAIAVSNDIAWVFVAFINSSAGLRIDDIRGSDGLWAHRTDMPFPEPCTAPKICSDRYRGCYVASTTVSSGCLVLGRSSMYGGIISPTATDIPGINSFDIAACQISRPGSSRYDMILGCTNTDYAYVRLYPYDDFTNPIPTDPYTAMVSPGGGESGSICVASDSVWTSNPPGYAGISVGAIVAWDHNEWVPALNAFSHILLTQRVAFYSDGLAMQWYSPVNLVGYSYVQSTDTKPDIVWKWNPDGQNILGVVAWNDDRIHPCQMDETIRAQCINYAEYSWLLAKLWDPDGELLSPQIGGVLQTDIQIERCSDESGVAMVSGYWMDSRAGLPLVVGTKFDDVIDENSHALVIRKESADKEMKADVRSLQLSQNYPNPVSVSARGITTIGFVLPRDGQYSMRLYDAMGRLVTVLASGWYNAGSYTFQVTSAILGRLPSGVYRYELVSGGSSVSRMMIVVN
jgi:hypothetical protein